MPIERDLVLGRTDQGDHTVITMVGEIDVDNLRALRALIEDCLRAGIRVIDVDLSALTFCDVTGLNLFLSAQSRTRTLGGGAELHLHDAGPAVIRLLDLTGTRANLTGAPTPSTTEAPAERASEARCLTGARAGAVASRPRSWPGRSSRHLR